MIDHAINVFMSQPVYFALDPDDFEKRVERPVERGFGIVAQLTSGGMVSFTWCRPVTDKVTLKIINGQTLDDDDWEVRGGAAFIVDMAATPGTCGRKVGKFLRWVVVNAGIAREGEVVVFRRSGGSVPGRMGYFVARG